MSNRPLVKVLNPLGVVNECKEPVRRVRQVRRITETARRRGSQGSTNFVTSGAAPRFSAGSVGRNIAEGFGRRSHRDFARFLDQAISSLTEVEDCIIEAEMRGHLNPQQVAELEGLVRATSSPLAGLLRYLRNNPDTY